MRLIRKWLEKKRLMHEQNEKLEKLLDAALIDHTFLDRATR